MPATVYSQPRIDCTFYTNDSIFREKLLDALIFSDQEDSIQIEAIWFNEQDNKILYSTQQQKVFKGFNAVTFYRNKAEINDLATKSYLDYFGFLPPGNYKFQLVTKSLNGNFLPIRKEYAVESLTNNNINLEYTSIHNTKNIRFKWNFEYPSALKSQIRYHFYIDHIPQDLLKYGTVAASHQWFPDLSTDSLVTTNIKHRLKKNKYYSCYVEAYIGDNRIAVSPKSNFFYGSPSKSHKKIIDSNYLNKIDSSSFIQHPNQSALLQPLQKKLKVLEKFRSIDSNSIIRISGSTTIESQFSTQKFQNSEIPSSYARWYINPTVHIYNIPITAGIRLTTENNNSYNLNSVQFKFNVQEFRNQQLQSLKGKIPETGNFNNYMESRKKAIEERIKRLESEASNLKESRVKDSMQYVGAFSNPLSKTKSIDTSDVISNFNQKKASKKLRKKYKSSSIARNYYKNKERSDSIRNEIVTLKEEFSKVEKEYNSIKNKTEKYSDWNPDTKKILMENSFLNKGSNFLSKALLYVDQFDGGQIFPIFSELTLAGIGIKGINTTLSNNKYYFKGVYGNIYNNFNQTNTYNVAGAKSGIGTEQGTHCFISFINFSPNSISREQSLTNRILSADLQFNFKNIIILQTEINKSFKFNSQEKALTQSQITSTTSDKNTSYSFNAIFSPNKMNSRIIGAYRIIPRNYFTLGNPYLRTDVSEYEGRIEQFFFKRRILLGGFYKSSIDNLSKLKSTTTRFNNYGTEMSINFRKLPVIRISYSPSSQQRVAEQPSVDNNFKSTILNINSTYIKRISKFTSVTQAAYVLTTLDYNERVNLQSVLIMQQVQISDDKFIRISANSTKNRTPSSTYEILELSSTFGITFKKIWQNSFTISQTQSNNINRVMYYYQTGIVLNRLLIQVRIGKQNFNNIISDENSQPITINGSISWNW